MQRTFCSISYWEHLTLSLFYLFPLQIKLLVLQTHQLLVGRPTCPLRMQFFGGTINTYKYYTYAYNLTDVAYKVPTHLGGLLEPKCIKKMPLDHLFDRSRAPRAECVYFDTPVIPPVCSRVSCSSKTTGLQAQPVFCESRRTDSHLVICDAPQLVRGGGERVRELCLCIFVLMLVRKRKKKRSYSFMLVPSAFCSCHPFQNGQLDETLFLGADEYALHLLRGSNNLARMLTAFITLQ